MLLASRTVRALATALIAVCVRVGRQISARAVCGNLAGLDNRHGSDTGVEHGFRIARVTFCVIKSQLTASSVKCAAELTICASTRILIAVGVCIGRKSDPSAVCGDGAFLRGGSGRHAGVG